MRNHKVYAVVTKEYDPKNPCIAICFSSKVQAQKMIKGFKKEQIPHSIPLKVMEAKLTI